MSKKATLWIVLIAIATALCGCPSSDGAGDGNTAAKSGALKVAATTGMVADLVRAVGGEHVQVTALMGPGTDPHYYKPTPSNVDALTTADLIFYNGLELEGRMADTLERLAETGKATVAVADAVPVEERRQPREFQGRYDPHIWFDVTLWRKALGAVETALIEKDPTNAKAYLANAEAYRAELEGLHSEIQREIATLPEAQRVLVTAHDAFGYFGKQYGVEVRGLQGTSTTTEAGAKDVQELARFIADRKIKALFVESSVPPATIEAVQKAVQARGWDVKIGGQLFSDAMGAEGTPEGTYIGMVRHNVRTMVEALK
ncbi:MAG: zinc ABC transporter substrate-binding protein [Armatimonadaceae bacterium]